ncbi:hypothetical protein [Flavobacterium hungaricum]|uniref:Transmembrane protein n=1 Tax=Flavobacterium hungaricum TaxID=2082725 RepID=A0ABR9TRG1_9FLAO|nr:hypothetical protein [Flavobacterium hungaricum]MBE8727965.1 hypothetical protein [Flavobacterium hungaricum]
MKKIISNDFKNELTPSKIFAKVVVSVIVGVGWYSIQNLYEYIPNIYKNISQSLYDRMIISVAHGPRNHDALIMSFIMFFSTLFLTAACIYSYMLGGYLEKRIADEATDIESVDDVEREITEANKQKLKYVKIIGKSKFVPLVLGVVSGMLFIAVQFSNSQKEAEADMIRDFNRKIKIITPYVDLKVKDKIISDFSLMKNENDYLKINKRFEVIFKQNKLNP